MPRRRHPLQLPLAGPGIFALQMPCGHVNPSEVADVREWRWLRRGEGAASSGARPVIPPLVLDAGIALAVAALGAASGLGARHQAEHVPAAAVPVLAAMGLILLPRRRFPATVLVAMAALVEALVLMHTSLEGGFVAVLIASYSAAVYGSRRLAAALAMATATVLLGYGTMTALGAGPWLRARIPLPTLLAAAGAWLVGLVIRSQFAARNTHLAMLAERAELVAERQQEQARQATMAERLRIGRELHDIVAHHLSVVVIHAQGAQRMIGPNPDRAMAARCEVEQTGRTALNEMRRLLGLLRSGEPADDDSRSPDATAAAAPGIGDVGDLAGRMRAAGLAVTVQTCGLPRCVPGDVGLTAYRIVQEALPNVLQARRPAQRLPAQQHRFHGRHRPPG